MISTPPDSSSRHLSNENNVEPCDVNGALTSLSLEPTIQTFLYHDTLNIHDRLDSFRNIMNIYKTSDAQVKGTVGPLNLPAGYDFGLEHRNTMKCSTGRPYATALVSPSGTPSLTQRSGIFPVPPSKNKRAAHALGTHSLTASAFQGGRSYLPAISRKNPADDIFRTPAGTTRSRDLHVGEIDTAKSELDVKKRSDGNAEFQYESNVRSCPTTRIRSLGEVRLAQLVQEEYSSRLEYTWKAHQMLYSVFDSFYQAQHRLQKRQRALFDSMETQRSAMDNQHKRMKDQFFRLERVTRKEIAVHETRSREIHSKHMRTDHRSLVEHSNLHKEKTLNAIRRRVHDCAQQEATQRHELWSSQTHDYCLLQKLHRKEVMTHARQIFLSHQEARIQALQDVGFGVAKQRAEQQLKNQLKEMATVREGQPSTPFELDTSTSAFFKRTITNVRRTVRNRRQQLKERSRRKKKPESLPLEIRHERIQQYVSTEEGKHRQELEMEEVKLRTIHVRLWRRFTIQLERFEEMTDSSDRMHMEWITARQQIEVQQAEHESRAELATSERNARNRLSRLLTQGIKQVLENTRLVQHAAFIHEHRVNRRLQRIEHALQKGEVEERFARSNRKIQEIESTRRQEVMVRELQQREEHFNSEYVWKYAKWDLGNVEEKSRLYLIRAEHEVMQSTLKKDFDLGLFRLRKKKILPA